MAPNVLTPQQELEDVERQLTERGYLKIAARDKYHNSFREFYFATAPVVRGIPGTKIEAAVVIHPHQLAVVISTASDDPERAAGVYNVCYVRLP